MELEETLYWFEIVEGSGLIASQNLQPLKKEAEELIAIFVSLINKWRRK